MDTEFLVQMRQSNKCGSVRNDEILNLHLGSGADGLRKKESPIYKIYDNSKDL